MQKRFSSPTLVNCLARLLLAGSGWLAGCSGTHESGQTAAMPTPHLVATPHPVATPATNVPALLGMSIDKLSERLGPARPLPPGFTNPLELLAGTTGLGRQDSLTAFRTGGLTLVASYDARTRQVGDLLLLGHREDSLMAQGTLRTNARDYLVLPVFRASRPGHLIGLRIVATN